MKGYVLIVEDDFKLARIIKAYLEGADFRAMHASSGKEAMKLINEDRPIAVLLDLGLPDISGEELCQDIKELADIPIIMVTAKSAEEEKIAGFSLGADDYVVKPASPRELVYRLKAILKRYDVNQLAETKLSFNNGYLVLRNTSHEVLLDGKTITVTPTEFKLLVVLASSPSKTFSRDELVTKALGYQFEGYERSVDAHIKNLRQKIETDSKQPKFIKTVYGFGYMFCGVQDAANVSS